MRNAAAGVKAMKDYRLDGMLHNAVAADLETDLVQPGLLAPPLVLGGAAELGPDGCVHGVILDKAQVRALFLAILRNPAAVLCGANIAYDVLVLLVDFAKRGVDISGDIFAMYDPEMTIVRGYCDGRVFEIQLAEPLDAIANGHVGKHRISGETIINKQTGRPGRYSLDTVTFEVQGREDAKTNDRFRLSYAQFHDVPIEQLPFEARQYPIDDAVNTLGNALGQAGHLPSVNRHVWDVERVPPFKLRCRYCKTYCDPTAPQACVRKQRRRNLQGLAQQAYFAWAVHIGSAWGLNIPQDEVDKLEARIDATREASVGPFKAAGIIREEGTVNESVLKRLTAIAYGARDQCPECISTVKKDGTPLPGKVISPTTGKTFVNCKACDGSGLRLPPECPRTPSGEIACGRDALCESGDELLMEYGEQPSRKIKTTFIPMLRRGRACNVCGRTGAATKYRPAHEDWCTAQNGEAGYRPIPFTPSVNPLLETERAAIEEGLHSIPRKGGVRECIVARGPQYEEIEVPDDYVLKPGEEIIR